MDIDSVHSGFQNVDESGEADFFINYLKFVDSVPEFRAIKERNYEALGLKKGDNILDAGCGIGLDTCRLGIRVGETGSAIGVDSSESMISIAQKNIPGHLRNTTFVIGNMRNPDFPDNTFDAIFVERLLQILPNPVQIIQQLVRVLKPGGTLVIVEPDWGTMALDPGNRNIIRSLVSYCTDSFADGWTGRKLYRYFVELGLDVRIEAEPVIMHDFSIISRAMNFDNFVSGAVKAGQISQKDADELVEGFRLAGEHGRFFFSYMMYRAIGKKPK
jgi:ubiquinone/menaquinone biosynthesis C-methylase UbiE